MARAADHFTSLTRSMLGFAVRTVPNCKTCLLFRVQIALDFAGFANFIPNFFFGFTSHAVPRVRQILPSFGAVSAWLQTLVAPHVPGLAAGVIVKACRALP